MEGVADGARGEHLVGRALGGDPPLPHHHEVIGVAQGKIQIVDDHSNGLALAAVQVAHEGHEVVAGADIQIGGGLVQHDEVGVLGECAGHMGTLTLAARKLVQVMIAEDRDPGPFHGGFHGRAIGRPESAAPPQVRMAAAGHQSLHGHGRHAGGLGQHGHQMRPFARGQLTRVVAGHFHPPRHRAQKAGGQLHQRRFPAAVGTDDARHRAGGDGGGKPFHEGGTRLVGERDALVADGALRRARPNVGGTRTRRRSLAPDNALSQGRLLCSSG